MSEIEEKLDFFVSAVQQFMDQLFSFLPQVLGAIIILILGWIVAKIIKKLAIRTLQLVKFDTLTQKAGVEEFLAQGGIGKSVTELLGGLFYWLVMFIVFLSAFNILGLSIASELINEVVKYIPNIIVAVIVLIFGLYLAKFLTSLLVAYMKNIGITNVEFVTILVQGGIVFFVVSIVLTQLNIGVGIVTSAFQLLFGAICLALGLAFGLGGKDWAAKVIERYSKGSEN